MNELELIRDVARNVLLPLAVGGELRPPEPIGERLAMEAAQAAAEAEWGGLDEELGYALYRARNLGARGITPIDELEPMDEAQWLLAFSLSDLLQSTNPALAGWAGAGRPLELLEMVDRVLERVGPPMTAGCSLGRYATFWRLFELIRRDTTVSWWTGSRVFLGRPPPERLMAWPALRRVRTEEREVAVEAMAGDGPLSDAWLHVFRRFVAAIPLLDLATADRASPPFHWSGNALGLLRAPSGRRLGVRAIDRFGRAAAVADVLARRGDDVPQITRKMVRDFVSDLRALAERRSAFAATRVAGP